MIQGREDSRYMKETPAARYCGLSCTTFRKHVLPLLHPVKFGRRTVLYDRQEIDLRLAERARVGAPSPIGEEAAWLAKLDGDTSARR